MTATPRKPSSPVCAIRTTRVHIAKLAATPGSGSRAQLGYLIGRSGILDPAE